MRRKNKHNFVFSRKITIFSLKTTIWNLLYNQYSVVFKTLEIKEAIMSRINSLMTILIKNRGKVMHALNLDIVFTILKQDFG